MYLNRTESKALKGACGKMLDVLIEILKFLVENLWVSLGLGISIFISLVILENSRIKHYGEATKM
jgi:hypothetical protein